MNVIFIMLDSFRQDHISLYNEGKPVFDGIPPCKTPNLDRFARDGVIFYNVYPEGLPTIPVRTELMTGQQTLPYRPWQPLTKEDVTIAEILREESYICGLISDTYHYRAPGMNFHRGFHSYRWIRGQEYDPYTSWRSRRNVEDYVNKNYTQEWRARVEQYLSNTDDMEEEDKRFPAQVVSQAIEWLKKSRNHKKVFLWVDSFDPHEPWDPPKRFDKYTDPNYKGPRLILPMGGRAGDWATPEEIRYIRGLYAGEAEFVDYCLGALFDTLEELGYYDDSLIVITADHGHPLCDHGKFLKGADRMYSELLKVPFIMRFPRGEFAGRKIYSLIQFQDVLPTILDIIGLKNNTSSMHGRSFLPVVKGDKDSHRDAVIIGYYEGIDRCIRDLHWSYIQRPEGEPDELYNLDNDPKEENNLIDKYPEEALRLSSMFGSYFRNRNSSRIVKGVQGKYEMSSGSVE
ncbi:MAG: sulfatase-like hydrolase/transferase [bacterium]|nr:sulfatase-like hydrolase/transferase [bacterium]